MRDNVDAGERLHFIGGLSADSQAEEDLALYLEAMGRLKSDDGRRLTEDEVWGEDYQPVDDGYEPEFD